MTERTIPSDLPEILAPAGDSQCFLSALAAGADAIYLGMKQFSARMQADNFATADLARLTELAHDSGVHVHVAMNTLLKPGDLQHAYNIVARLQRDVHPDALIVQDLAMLDIARQAGFTGGLHLSTLANASHPAAMQTALDLGATRVVLPRELSIDEMKYMAEQCPEGLELECFIHGALCYCVSGRCYWSSYMGGKSGLRGRCVQPCRRLYKQGGSIVEAAAAKYASQENDRKRGSQKNRKPAAAKERAPRSKMRTGRYFSCKDLSLDVLAKTLFDIPHLNSWKIEGRKKGPHYVYHAVTAYKMLRDNPNDAKAKKEACSILEMALGRPACHAHYLSHKNQQVTSPDESTSSGMLVGKVSSSPEGRPFFKPYIDLMPKDFLRIGIEDEPWHATLPVTRRTPKAGTFTLSVPPQKTPKNGTPVYLIDRRQSELMQILRVWQEKLARTHTIKPRPVSSHPTMPAHVPAKRLQDITVRSVIPHGHETKGPRNAFMGLWLTSRTAGAVSKTVMPRVSWWLPPVLWPEGEKALAETLKNLVRSGARHFVCNTPWQIRLFPDGADVKCTAGPFCNIANASALGRLESLGYTAAVVSPELAREDMITLPHQSPIPLGCLLDGFWPVGISRFGLNGIKSETSFVSPRGEIFWTRMYSGNVWLYPGWPMDLTDKRDELTRAGYAFFVSFRETPPENLPKLARDGAFNWNGSLL